MRHFLAIVFLAILTICASPVLAQDTPDYDAWNQFAEEAEQMVSDAETTDAELQRLRGQLVEWRERLDDAGGVNGDRIATLRSQIDALGPVPADGAEEDPNVAQRRSELNEQLSEAQAPRLAANEAEGMASSIIARIDEIIRQRAAKELTKQSPSPMLPGSWTAATMDGIALLEGVMGEISGANASDGAWESLRPNLPKVVLYLLAAILILTFGRRWIDSLPSRLSARASEYSRAVLAFVVSLGQIALPMLGVFLGISAIQATGLPGPWTTPFLNVLPVAAVILFGGIWLSRALFPRQAIAYTSLQMTEKARIAAGRAVNALAALMALHHILSRAVLPLSGLYEQGGTLMERVPVTFTEAAAGVWHLVLVAVTALVMFRLGNILRRIPREAGTQNLAYRHYILGWAGALTRILAPLAVVAIVAGFINFGNLMVWPWLYSLALVGLLILLQDFIADLFNMMQRGAEGARDGLAPLLIGFGLVLLSIPLFLIILGSTGEELIEYWVKFREGVSLGGIRLSPGSIIMFLIVFAIGYVVTRGVQGAFRNSILPKTKLDAGGQNALVSGLGYVGIVLAAIMAITSAGIDLSSLAIVAGALSVGIGFGLQNVVSNFVSGIILLIERPVSVGDWVSAGGQQGIVKKISVRATLVETFDKTEVIVPNSDLISQPVTNWTRHNKIGRIIVPIGVAYGSDTREVEKILHEVVEDHPLISIDPPPAVLFRGLGADSLDFEIRAILSDVGNGLGVTSDLLHEVVRRFADAGIEIPFAQRDIWLRNPEALAAGEKPAPKPAPVRSQAMSETARSLPDADEADGDGR